MLARGFDFGSRRVKYRSKQTGASKNNAGNQATANRRFVWAVYARACLGLVARKVVRNRAASAQH